MTTLFILAGGVALVPLVGGSLRRLSLARVPFATTLVIAFLVQGLARGRFMSTVNAGAFAVTLWGVSGVLLIALLSRIRSVPSVGVAMLGLASNLLVVLLNGGMPVAAPHDLVGPSGAGFYVALDASTVLPVLGDVLPGHACLVSIGDVLLSVGALTGLLELSCAREFQQAESAYLHSGRTQGRFFGRLGAPRPACRTGD